MKIQNYTWQDYFDSERKIIVENFRLRERLIRAYNEHNVPSIKQVTPMQKSVIRHVLQASLDIQGFYKLN